MVHLPAESRIVGGTNAAAGLIPFFSGHGCGGSLIADDMCLLPPIALAPLTEKSTLGPKQYKHGRWRRAHRRASSSPHLANLNTERMTSCCSNQTEACRFEQKQPPQRRSDCDRLWCHVGRRADRTKLNTRYCNTTRYGGVLSTSSCCVPERPVAAGRLPGRLGRSNFQCGWRAGWCGELGYGCADAPVPWCLLPVSGAIGGSKATHVRCRALSPMH
jgi:hypothetical protein